jgi:glyoxylase-like metal-dependent hydrolase (beta-lactamase superfamily II)
MDITPELAATLPLEDTGPDRRMEGYSMHVEGIQAENRMKHTTPHERELPHKVTEDIWMWSIYNEDKDIHFNGYIIRLEDSCIIVDPPSANELLFDAIRAITVNHPVRLVVITNRDHERESLAFKLQYDVPVAAPELDAPLLEANPDQMLHDGDMLPGGIRVVHLPNQKSPGEIALYIESRKMLFLGDALWGKPMHHLTMLPDDKYVDKAKAREGLQRLLKLNVQTVLPCDGEPVMQNAQSLIADAIK